MNKLGGDTLSGVNLLKIYACKSESSLPQFKNMGVKGGL